MSTEMEKEEEGAKCLSRIFLPSLSPPLIHLILQNLREIPPPTQMLATFLFRSFRQALNVYPSSLLFSTANRNHLAYCKCEI
jgi:hypothetical protein